MTFLSGRNKENGLAPCCGVNWKIGVVVPFAPVTFSSWEGKFDAVPVAETVDPFGVAVTFKFALIPGVMNCGTGDNGFFTS